MKKSAVKQEKERQRQEQHIHDEEKGRIDFFSSVINALPSDKGLMSLSSSQYVVWKKASSKYIVNIENRAKA